MIKDLESQCVLACLTIEKDRDTQGSRCAAFQLREFEVKRQ